MKAAQRSKQQSAARRSPAAWRAKPKNIVHSPLFTATEAKNEFGRILEKAIRGETVVITKHETPKAVLISVEQFHALKHAPKHAPGFKLDSVSREFDALMSRMQTLKVRAAMQEVFHAAPPQLGRAAVRAARKQI